MLTKTIIENVLILFGESFWVFSAYAQLRRLLKTRNRLGLSAVSLTITAAGNIAWASYFTSRHLWVPVVTNIVMLCVVTTSLAYVVGNRKQFLRGLLTIIFVGPITSFCLIKFPHGAGWLGAAYNQASATPWIFHLVRHKKSSGISPHALLWSYAAIAGTLAYAILIVSWPLIAGCLLGIIMQSVITRYYLRFRKHS